MTDKKETKESKDDEYGICAFCEPENNQKNETELLICKGCGELYCEDCSSYCEPSELCTECEEWIQCAYCNKKSPGSKAACLKMFCPQKHDWSSLETLYICYKCKPQIILKLSETDDK